MFPPRQDHRPEGVSRRQFLKSLGTGVIAVGASGMADAVSVGGLLGTEAEAAPIDFTLPGRFGRMFPGLPPFAPANDAVRAALMELGKPNGLLDAHDDLTAGPEALITDPDLRVNNPDNPTHTAGTTFMGQFLDHDITFDTTSRLGVPTRPITAPTRIPTALHWAGGGRRHPGEGAQVLHALPRPSVHSGRVSDLLSFWS